MITNEMTEFNCPSCEGTGESRAIVNRGADGCSIEQVACSTCGGSGQVPADYEERLVEIEHCPQSEDEMHCVHWWDGEPCCKCGSDEGEVDG